MLAKMKLYSVFCVILVLIGGASLALAQEDVDPPDGELMILKFDKRWISPKEPHVPFDHSAHDGFDCADCHFQTENHPKKFGKCADSCHPMGLRGVNPKAHDTPKSYHNVMHKTCIRCHRDNDMETHCGDCHIKPDK